MFTKQIDIKVHFAAAMQKSCRLVTYADYQFTLKNPSKFCSRRQVKTINTTQSVLVRCVELLKVFSFRFGIFIFKITGTLLEKWNTIIKKINK